MELSSVFTSETLKAADLQGREVAVVIAAVEAKQFTDGNKLLLTFQGKKKALVCNKTNANRIAYLYGTNTDGWVGREIVLFADLVDFQGKTVEAIRIKPPTNRAEAQQHAKPVPSRVASAAPVAARGGTDMDDEIPF